MDTSTRISYTMAQAAAETGLSERTIRRAVKNGDIAARHFSARRILIERAELESWIGALPSQPAADSAA